MKHLIAVTAACITFSAAAIASPLTDAYSSFVVLGDSLSDNGNLFAFDPAFVPSPPYVDGKFSNGEIWNESIAAEYTETTTRNFAFGGATTTGGSFAPPSLDKQIALLGGSLLDPVAPLILGATPLVSVWAGANDIRNAIFADPSVNVEQVAIQAANNVTATIGTLSALGVNDFLVFNLPDLGATAEANLLGYGPVASPATAAYNALLATNIALLEGTGINIIEVDIASLFADLIDNPDDYGVGNATEACVLNPVDCNPANWLFWDGIHPTAFGHSLVQEQARLAIAAELAPVPLPASAPLLLAGFGLLGWYGRRRQAA